MTTVDWLDRERGRGGLSPQAWKEEGIDDAGVKGCKRSRHGLGLIECSAALSVTAAHCTAAAPCRRSAPIAGDFADAPPPATLRIYGRFTDFYALLCDPAWQLLHFWLGMVPRMVPDSLGPAWCLPVLA